MKTPSQLAFPIKKRGGKRRGAGRKKTRMNEPSHARRARIDSKKPLMLTLKCAEKVPGLRTPKFMKWFARIVRLASQKGLRVLQYAIEGNHIHLIVEAASNRALETGMQSFLATMAWALRDVFNYHGKILNGRFHTLICETPTQVKNALRYVLFNHAKHCEEKPFIDAYSSAGGFDAVEVLAGTRLRRSRPRWTVDRPPAESWLLRIGWRKAVTV